MWIIGTSPLLQVFILDGKYIYICSLIHSLSLKYTHTHSHLAGSINVSAGSVVKIKGKRSKKFTNSTWCVCSWIFSCFRKEEPPIGATTFQNEEPPTPEVSLSLSLPPSLSLSLSLFLSLSLSPLQSLSFPHLFPYTHSMHTSSMCTCMCSYMR